MTVQYHTAEPVAWRVRRLSDDPEEWQLRPAGAALDFGNPKRWEVQPLFTRPAFWTGLLDSLNEVAEVTAYDPADLPAHEYAAIREGALARAAIAKATGETGQ